MCLVYTGVQGEECSYVARAIDGIQLGSVRLGGREYETGQI